MVKNIKQEKEQKKKVIIAKWINYNNNLDVSKGVD